MRDRDQGFTIRDKGLAISEFCHAPRPASTLNRRFPVGRIVVGELLTRLDVPGGDDPDRLADNLRVAVRFAGVIDVAGDVAADGGVANVEAIELEAPDVAALQVADLALEADRVANLLARVVDDAFV